MLYRLLCLSCLTLLLTGCGLAQRQQFEQAKKSVEAIKAECEAKKQSREFTKWVQVSDCEEPRIKAQYKAIHYPYMDLIDLILAKDRVINEAVDKHKLSEAEGELEKAKARTEASQLLAQRLGVAAQQQAASAASYNAIMQNYNANRPRTCTGYGNSVTCY